MEEKNNAIKKRTVDSETAGQELKRFLDLKRIPERKRHDLYAQGVKELAFSVEEGSLIFDFEKKIATYFLLHPLTKKDGSKVEKLAMRFHMGVSQAQSHLNGVDPEDGNDRSLGILSALSGVSMQVLKIAENSLGESGLDTGDFSLLRYYALFFLA